MPTRKTTQGRTTRKAGAGKTGERVKDSANKIWLAGLGAFAMAEEEGGKLFKNLVAKGKDFEEVGREQLTKAREKVEELAESAKEKLESATGEVRGKAGEAWEKVEEGWDDRMSRAMHRLGVPTRDEISRLTRRIEDLTQLVQQQAKTHRTRAHKAATPRRRSSAQAR